MNLRTAFIVIEVVLICAACVIGSYLGTRAFLHHHYPKSPQIQKQPPQPPVLYRCI